MTSKPATRFGFGRFPIAGFYWLLPAAAVAGGLAIAPFQAILGVLGVPITKLKPGSAWLWVFLLTLAAFVGYAALSHTWSPYRDPSQTWKLAGGVACGLLFVAGAGADSGARRLVRAAGAAGLLVLGALLLIEAFGDMPLNRLDQPAAETGVLMRNPGRGATVLVCLMWPAIAALAGGDSLSRAGWKVVLVMGAVLAFQFDMSSNTLALGIGLAGYLLGWAAPRLAVLLLSLGLAAWMLAAPWAMLAIPSNAALLQQLPDSWAVRMEMWRFVAEQIAANPLLGAGLDASRTFDGSSSVNGVNFSLVSMHPHSGSLQIWLELGAVGAGLAALAILVGGIRLSSVVAGKPAWGAAAAGVLASIGLVANVSYGVWQEWWIATAFAAAALVCAVPRAEPAAETEH